MPWKRLFRWLVRIAIVCLALFVIAVGVVLNWVRIDARERYSGSSYRLLVLAAGLKNADGSREEIIAQLRKQPDLFFALLENDSFRVRTAARRLLLDFAQQTDESTFDRVAAEMHDEVATEREFMVAFLANAGKPGAQRLAALYRATREIDLTLQWAVCGEIGRGFFSADLIPALAEIVADPTIAPENRCRAAEAIGCLFTYREDWGSDLPRCRTATILHLRDLLPKLSDPVAGAVRLALKRSEDEEVTRQEKARPDPEFANVWPEIAKGDPNAAIAALSDQYDWQKVGWAADALARNGVKEAIPALRRVAESHWFSPVRKTAQRAVRVLEGRESYLPPSDESGQFTAPFRLEEFQHEEVETWHETHRPHPHRMVFLKMVFEPVRDACFWRFQPRIDQAEFQRPGRLPRRDILLGAVEIQWHPKHAIDFAGGKLLGYDKPFAGGGTVFCRKGAMAQIFYTDRVCGFASMPFGVLILTRSHTCFPKDEIYLAKKSEDGTITVTEFLRLPSEGERFQPQPNGDLRIECEGGDVIITTTGGIRMATD
jgi:hypothetical protein